MKEIRLRCWVTSLGLSWSYLLYCGTGSKMSMCQRTELGQGKRKELEMTRTVRLLGFSAYYCPRQKEGVLRGLGHFS